MDAPPTAIDEQPPEHPRFPDEAQERDYLAASDLFINPPRVQEKSRFLLITLGVFVATSFMQGGTSITELALLIGVLFVHELGHALGMRVFGYTDVRIFFIPLFGAAAAGRKRGVARWKEGVVLLMGPLPGLIAGTVLLLTGAEGLLRTLALQLVAINGFNLLPLSPLDGGQLFQLLLFSRHRHLELGFQMIASLTMLIGGIYLKLYILAIVGGFMLVTMGIRKHVLAAGSELRAQQLPRDPIALDDTQRRTLFAALWKWMPVQWRSKPRPQAGTMEQILDVATRQPTGLGVSFALFIGWAAAVAITVLAAFTFLHGPPAQWKVHQDPKHHFAVELPASATETTTSVPGQGMLVAQLGRAEYGVTWMPLAAGADWRLMREPFLENAHGKLVRDVAMPDGPPAMIVTLEGHDTWVLIRGTDELAFIVIGTGPDELSERVIRSFRVTQ